MALLGLAAVAVPVLIHLLMRPKPKRVVFPALRLIEVTRRRNTRSVRLRHLRVLLLRAAALAVPALIIARPLVPVGLLPSAAAWGVFGGMAAATAGGFWLWRRYWVETPRSPGEVRARRAVWSTSAVAAAFLVPLLWAGGVWAASSGAIPLGSPVGGRDAPLAVVYVFDDSAGMGYVRDGRTRLEAAKEAATRHAGTLPAGSRAGVMTASSPELPVLFGDRAVVAARIEEATLRTTATPLNEPVRRAVEVLADDAAAFESGSDPYARVVIVLSDLTAGSWSDGPVIAAEGDGAGRSGTAVVLVDVGVDDPENRAITDVTLSGSETVAGGGVEVRATVEVGVTDGGGGPAVVEFLSGGPDGLLVPRARRRLDASGEVVFTLPTPEAGVTRAVLRLDGGDPLDCDDTRFVAVGVAEPESIELVADDPDDAFLIAAALESVSAAGSSPYRVTTVTPREFADGSPGERPRDFWFVNLQSPTASAWREANRRVAAGAEGVVVLGGAADVAAYSGDAAAGLMPLVPVVALGFDPPANVEFLRTATEPFATLDEWGATAELAGRDVRRHWRSEPAPESTLWAAFGGGEDRVPAIASRTVGRGRAWAVTTDLSGGRWNDWASSGWPYLALVDRLAASGRDPVSDRMFDPGAAYISENFSAGGKQLLLRTPALDQSELPDAPSERAVVLGGQTLPGHYAVVARGENGEPREDGFAVNVPDGESDLTRLDPGRFDEILGAGRYAVVRDLAELDRVVLDETAGVEPGGLLAAILLLLLCGESWIANRFYRDEAAGPQAGRPPVGSSPAATGETDGVRSAEVPA